MLAITAASKSAAAPPSLYGPNWRMSSDDAAYPGSQDRLAIGFASLS